MKENISILKENIRNYKWLKLIILITSLILPSMILLTFINIRFPDILNVGSFLWVGFYSCIFLIYFIDSSLPSFLKTILIILNASVILFVMLGSLMGGLQGLSIVIIKMILPFIPTKWIASLIFGAFGYPEP